MKYWPIENIIYKTKLTKSEIVRNLSENATSQIGLRDRLMRKKTKPYEGYMVGNKFEITRVSHTSRNSFRPKISGIVQEGTDETLINVKMRMNPIVIVFLSCYSMAILLIIILFLFIESETPGFRFLVFLPLFMLLFTYGLTMSGFKYESSKSKNDLKRIFESTEVIE